MPAAANIADTSRPVTHGAWHTLTADETAARLTTSELGLSDDEVARRLGTYGANEIAEERATPWWRILLHQFNDPLVIAGGEIDKWWNRRKIRPLG